VKPGAGAREGKAEEEPLLAALLRTAPSSLLALGGARGLHALLLLLELRHSREAVPSAPSRAPAEQEAALPQELPELLPEALPAREPLLLPPPPPLPSSTSVLAPPPCWPCCCTPKEGKASKALLKGSREPCRACAAGSPELPLPRLSEDAPSSRRAEKRAGLSAPLALASELLKATASRERGRAGEGGPEELLVPLLTFLQARALSRGDSSACRLLELALTALAEARLLAVAGPHCRLPSALDSLRGAL
jgi:hypothetical protein